MNNGVTTTSTIFCHNFNAGEEKYDINKVLSSPLFLNKVKLTWFNDVDGIASILFNDGSRTSIFYNEDSIIAEEVNAIALSGADYKVATEKLLVTFITDTELSIKTLTKSYKLIEKDNELILELQ